MASNRLTWAALAAILASGGLAGCESTGFGSCETSSLPASDPCFGHDCCDVVEVAPLPDGGAVAVPPGADAGVATQQRFCGACNG